MTRHRFTVLSTPRLLVVGLLVFGAACHRQLPPPPAPARPPVQPKPPAAPSVASGAALVAAMHDRYAAHWYRTLTFRQRTTVSLSSGGQVVQTWQGADALPGRRRIDTDVESKSGVLYANDSTYTFSNGRLASATAHTSELLLLGEDLYAQPVARTIAELRELGFDLSRSHETTWQEKPVYVVGALRGDSGSKQFWVDRERLLVVRILERTSQGRADFRLADYVRAGDGWVAGQVVQLVNGKRRVVEEYDDLRVDVPLSEGSFDPRAWRNATARRP